AAAPPRPPRCPPPSRRPWPHPLVGSPRAAATSYEGDGRRIHQGPRSLTRESGTAGATRSAVTGAICLVGANPGPTVHLAVVGIVLLGGLVVFALVRRRRRRAAADGMASRRKRKGAPCESAWR